MLQNEKDKKRFKPTQSFWTLIFRCRKRKVKTSNWVKAGISKL